MARKNTVSTVPPSSTATTAKKRLTVKEQIAAAVAAAMAEHTAHMEKVIAAGDLLAADYAAAQSEVSSLKAELAKYTNSDVYAPRKDLINARTEVGMLMGRVDDLEAQVASQSDVINGLKAENERLTVQVEKQNPKLAFARLLGRDPNNLPSAWEHLVVFQDRADLNVFRVAVERGTYTKNPKAGEKLLAAVYEAAVKNSFSAVKIEGNTRVETTMGSQVVSGHLKLTRLTVA